MIKQLKEDIDSILKKSKIGHINVDYLIIYFISIKYFCEKGTYDYDEVINYEHLYNINHNVSLMNKLLLKDKELHINKLLRYYNDVKAKDLLFEYLNSLDKPVKFFDEKSLFIGARYNEYLFYDIDGKTTYIGPDNMNKEFYNQYKLFDEILGINNKYESENNIKLDDYNYLCIYDRVPRYRFNRQNNEYTIVDKYLNKIDNIILYTSYSKISNIRNCKHLLRYIKTIIIDSSNALVIFSNSVNESISIVNYNKLKMDDKKLKSIINSNRKQKDVLVKASLDEIRKNNYRVGFNLYQLQNNEQVKDINKIVDENTYYLEKLNRINQTVENEVNRLLNK